MFRLLSGPWLCLLLLTTPLLCQPTLSTDPGKLDGIKDVIHSAVSDAVKKHCITPTTESPDSSRCVSVCPEGFTACSGQCYSLQLAASDYPSAERRCAELNSTLAIPRTLTENLCVAGLSGGRRVWLGVTDRLTEGQFLAADGTPLGELDGHRWAALQPDDFRRIRMSHVAASPDDLHRILMHRNRITIDPEGEDCVEMLAPGGNFARWNDNSCSTGRTQSMCQLA